MLEAADADHRRRGKTVCSCQSQHLWRRCYDATGPPNEFTHGLGTVCVFICRWNLIWGKRKRLSLTIVLLPRILRGIFWSHVRTIIPSVNTKRQQPTSSPHRRLWQCTAPDADTQGIFSCLDEIVLSHDNKNKNILQLSPYILHLQVWFTKSYKTICFVEKIGYFRGCHLTSLFGCSGNADQRVSWFYKHKK